jgi:hypothetical protein
LKSGSFRIKRTYRRRGQVNVQIYDHYPRGFQANIDYTMGIDGKLKDPDGKVVTEGYHYETDEVPGIKPSVEEQRKRVKDEEKKLQQMEEEEKKKNKNKDKQKQDSISQESLNDKKDAVAYNYTPGFSISQSFF